MHDLLVTLSEQGFDIQAYVDDIVILIRGIFVDAISKRLQTVLNIVQSSVVR